MLTREGKTRAAIFPTVSMMRITLERLFPEKQMSIREKRNRPLSEYERMYLYIHQLGWNRGSISFRPFAIRQRGGGFLFLAAVAVQLFVEVVPVEREELSFK